MSAYDHDVARARWQAMYDRLRVALSAAESECETNGWSFPDQLADALRDIDRGQPGRITRTRPGSWEAEVLRQIIGEPFVPVSAAAIPDDMDDEPDDGIRPYIGEFA